MFIHNLKYTVKILFKNKVLIFWMFAFPIILGIFFHMAFENIEKDEALQVFDIAVIDNKEYQNQTIYQETFKELSDKKNKDQLFRIHFVNKKEAEQLLEDNEIEGYVLFNKQEPQIVIKENGMEQTILQFVMDEIKQNKRMIEDLTKKQIEDEIHIIFKKQREFGQAFASEKIEEEYSDIVLSQRSFEEGPGEGPSSSPSPYAGNQIEKKIGKCTIEKDEPRAVKGSYSFELFTLLQKN